MQLIGIHDSPFVRRVAVTARFLDIPLEYRQISIFRAYDEVRAINPMVKVPTLVCDDGQILVDSTLIIDYLESMAGGRKLMPSDEANYIAALSAIGASMVAMEKVVALIYETELRPQEIQHAPWVSRLEQQLGGACDLMEDVVGDGSHWLFDDAITQADISIAVAWRFVRYKMPDRIAAKRCPGLAAFSARAEDLPEFKACPID